MPAAILALSAGKKVFDVVILDHRSPKMDGRKVAVKILEQEPNQDIVMVTPYVKELVEYPIGIERAVTILQKPFELADLTSLLGRLSQKRKRM